MRGTGLIHIYYGDGKGKTTAAMGQAIRAAGSGLKVLVFQFMKNNSSNERKILEQIPNVTCLPGKTHVKFYNQMNREEKAEYRHYNTKALDEIAKFCINFDVLILDEAVCAADLGLLSEDPFPAAQAQGAGGRHDGAPRVRRPDGDGQLRHRDAEGEAPLRRGQDSQGGH